MADVLIAYNNDGYTELHTFFESCADTAKQHCYNKGRVFNTLFPPALTEDHVIQAMNDCDICFIASHGHAHGIHNEKSEDVVSTSTANYVFANKIFYSISCNCGQHLANNLIENDVALFVGYDAELKVGSNEELFVEAATEGFKHIVDGDPTPDIIAAINNKFEENIKKAERFEDQLLLLHNKEHLVFETA